MNDDREYYDRPGPVIAAGVALPLLDIALVLLRFYTRRKHKQSLQWDDWLLVPATLLTISMGIVVIYGVVKRAMGYPLELPPGYTGQWLDLKTSQIVGNWLIQWAIGMIMSVALTLIKVSILLFYLRIFALPMRTSTAIVLRGLVVLVCLWGAAFFLIILFQCRSTFWANYSSPRVVKMYCIDTTMAVFAHSITDFVVDVVIIVAPIPSVWQLRLPFVKKLGVSIVFLLGVVAVVASMLRLIILTRIVLQAFKPTTDGLIIATQYIYWSLIECGVGIAAACLPTLQRLFRHWSWDSVVSRVQTLYGSRSNMSYQAGDDVHSFQLVQSKGSELVPKTPESLGEVYMESETGVRRDNVAFRGNMDIRVLETV